MGKCVLGLTEQRSAGFLRGMRGVAPQLPQPWQCQANWCRARSLPPPNTVWEPDLEIQCTPGRGDRPAALTGDAPAKAVQGPCVKSVCARPGTVKWCARRLVCVHLLDSTFRLKRREAEPE